MKWEILKGSEKDFEGAPAWAVLVYKSTVRCFVGSHGEWKNEDSTCTYNNFEKHAGISFGEKLIAERRPITEPVVWLNLDECDGSEYLGPVIGKEMECHAKDGSIFAVVVVAFDGDLPIVKATHHGNYFGCDPIQLKPIRSAEDVARGAVAKGLVNFLDMETDRDNPFPMTELIGFYDYVAAGKIPGVKLE